LNSWKDIEQRRFDSWISPLPLIEAAKKRPELRQLFPFTSLYSICFSRTTGYPFTADCPHATPIGDGRFRAYSTKYKIVNRSNEGFNYKEAVDEVIGEGSAEEVIEMLVANLPPDCGPAVSGTAEDLIGGNEKPRD
jgi:hypothetical protein